ncbi:MAG: hypothetical protein A2Z20_00840 [Bdellovibrionales bacterium RBG_16_40_8]|nr:MAG: hypothetical protein A2Z20_00840 [Bdellovibrionales bacterium RBG_16_40_8]
MEQVKFIFGSIMIGMALYYIYPVTRGVFFDAIMATTFIAISIYFGAFSSRSLHKKFGKKVQRPLMLTLFILGLLFAVKSLLPEHMQKKIFSYSARISENNKPRGPEWFIYSDEILAKALQDKRPVIIDFHADWCLTCKELELYTFSDQHVIELGKQFVWLSFDATSPSEQLSALQNKYGIGGLPFIVIYRADGTQATDLTLAGFENAGQFFIRMKKALK